MKQSQFVPLELKINFQIWLQDLASDGPMSFVGQKPFTMVHLVSPNWSRRTLYHSFANVLNTLNAYYFNLYPRDKFVFFVDWSTNIAYTSLRTGKKEVVYIDDIKDYVHTSPIY